MGSEKKHQNRGTEMTLCSCLTFDVDFLSFTRQTVAHQNGLTLLPAVPAKALQKRARLLGSAPRHSSEQCHDHQSPDNTGP